MKNAIQDMCSRWKRLLTLACNGILRLLKSPTSERNAITDDGFSEIT